MNEVQGFLLEDCGIRGALVRLEETWRHVVAEHSYPARLESLLGDGVAAAVLLANGLQGRPQVSIQLQGNGALRLLLVQCTPDLRVRGMAQWRPHDRNARLLGDGRLVVNLDTGTRNGVYQGIVPLVSNELPACLEAYFDQSEQLPTRLILESDTEFVAGLKLQILPSQDATRAGFDEAAALAKTVSKTDLAQAPADELLLDLFGGYQVRLFKPKPVLHDCRCTAEHLANVARMLGEHELHQILFDEGAVELTCEFCNRTFRYDADDIDAIIRGETPVHVAH
jgi:molecular chaperone Hsp33